MDARSSGISGQRKSELRNLIIHHLDKFGEYTRASHQGDELSPADLIYIIENFSFNMAAAGGAYLRLIKHGELNDIKRLSKYMDFASIHLDGEGAIATACIYGRTDVLHYFVDELKLDINLFGIDPNYDAAEAVTVAAQHQQWPTITELMKPVSEGGFGYQLKANDVLFNYPLNPKQVVTAQVKPDELDQVTIFDTSTGQRQVYTQYSPQVQLGKGGYGSVWLYQYNGKKLAVKIPKQEWTNVRSINKDDAWANALDEYRGMRAAYPEEGPYALQKVVKTIDRQRFYSYRLVMPVVEGEKLNQMIRSKSDPLEQAKIILAVARELNDLHVNRNITHGDIRSGNVLIREDGQQGYRAHFIDFGFTTTIGRSAISTTGPDELKYFAPELESNQRVNAHPSQDEYSLARTLQWEIYNMQYPGRLKFNNKGEAEDKAELSRLLNFLVTDGWFAATGVPLLDSINSTLSFFLGGAGTPKVENGLLANFPVIKYFIRFGLSDDPEKRPPLIEFIQKLSEQIANYERRKNLVEASSPVLVREGLFNHKRNREDMNETPQADQQNRKRMR